MRKGRACACAGCEAPIQGRPTSARLRVTTVAAEAAHRLEGRAQGDLKGCGTWLLEAGDADGVDVTSRWEVVLAQRAPAASSKRCIAA